MRQREDEEDTKASSQPPKPFDIFAGLKMEELPKNPKPSDLGIMAPQDEPARFSSAKDAEHLPLNRLFEKYPRLLRYAAIAALALSIGIFFGVKLARGLTQNTP